MLARGVLTLGVLAAFATACSSFKGDLDQICRTASAVAELPPSEHGPALKRRLDGLSLSRPEARALASAIAAEPELGYERARAAARGQGLDWRCPGLQRITAPLTRGVSIRRDAVVVGGQRVGVKAGQADPRFKPRGAGDFVVEPLVKALKSDRPRSTVPVEVEGDLPVRLVGEVLHSAEAAGSGRLQLRLGGDLGEPHLVFAQRPPLERPTRLLLTVGITYEGFVVLGQKLDPTRLRCRASLTKGRCPLDGYDQPGLSAALQRLKGRFPEEQLAFLAAYREIPFRLVWQVLSTLKARGFDKVVLRVDVK